MIKIIISMFFLMFLPSCVLDEVVVSMRPNNGEPVFYFKPLKKTKELVWLTEVIVYEADTKKIVWEISTVDPSLIFTFVDGTPEGKRIRKKLSEIPPHEVKVVQVSQLTFGAVPDGFKQYVPSDNKKPVLAHNVEYILSAGGATGGGILFTLDGKCRRLSSTAYSEGHPLFKDTSGCMP